MAEEEKEKRVFDSRDFTVYKGSAGMQMRLSPYDPTVKKSGVVFLTVAPSVPGVKGRPEKGQVRYEWEAKKIVVALSLNDIGKLVWGLNTGTEVKLLHDPGAASENAGLVKKNIHLFPMENKNGFFLAVNEIKKGETNKVTVPISNEEVIVMRTLLLSSMPAMLGWR